MFILEVKYTDGTYGIRDTEDNSLDKCTRSEIKGFIKQGLIIQGVSVADNKMYLRPVKQDSFEGEAVRTVKSVSKGNDMSIFTPEQRSVIEDYYIWQTVSLYKSLAKSIRLGVQQSKIIELTRLRGNITWEFGGVIDTGYFGGGVCALGHSLRYEYLAVGYNEETGESDTLIFGETCAGDFLDISKEDIGKLVKVRKCMDEEIAHMIVCVKDRNQAIEDMSSFKDLLAYLNDLAKAKLSNRVLINFLAYFNSFMKVGIPFPSSLVKGFTRFLEEHTTYLSIGGRLYSPELGKLKKYDIFDESKKVYQDWYTRRDIANNFEHTLATYLWFFFTNRIEGMYAYDPVKEVCKKEGGFSKRAKLERSSLLQMFKNILYVSDFTYDEVKAVVFGSLAFLRLGNALYKECADDFAKYSDKISFEDIANNFESDDKFSNKLVKYAYSAVRAVQKPSRFSSNYIAENIEDLANILGDNTTSIDIYNRIYAFLDDNTIYGFTIRFKQAQRNEIVSVEKKLQASREDYEKNKLSLDDIAKMDLYNYYTRMEVKEACETLRGIKSDSEAGQFILNKNPILLDIPETVVKRNGCSRKQFNLIKWAMELLDEFNASVSSDNDTQDELDNSSVSDNVKNDVSENSGGVERTEDGITVDFDKLNKGESDLSIDFIF